ncbi:MAG: gas vesicle protein GvpN [Pseudomonadota bacterium]
MGQSASATKDGPKSGAAGKQMRDASANVFVETEAVRNITERSLTYLSSGYPVHFRGCAGSGKTALALRLAEMLERPTLFITGDANFTSANLIGRETGSRTKQTVDRYIHRVAKYEKETSIAWNDEALTQACTHGYTLVYDEFTRSRAEANNALLPVLEERVLILPASSNQEPFIRVHPEFRAIFTSNSSDYVGVQSAQDALLDRMITIDMDGIDRDTEIVIVSGRTGMKPDIVAAIVDVVRDFRESGAYEQMPTMRASIMIAQIAMSQKITVSASDPVFIDLCLDVLASKGTPGADSEQRFILNEALLDLIAAHCPN